MEGPLVVTKATTGATLMYRSRTWVSASPTALETVSRTE